MKKTPDGFVRDFDNPGAVINNDKDALLAYKRQKEKMREIERIKQEVQSIPQIKHELNEIKETLNAILGILKK